MLHKKMIWQLIKQKSWLAFTLLVLFCPKDLIGQNKITNFYTSPIIDSLQTALKNAKNDSDWVSTFNALTLQKMYRTWELSATINGPGNIDSINNSIMSDASKALKLAQHLNYKKEIAWAYEIISRMYEFKNELAQAINCHFKELSISEEIRDSACATQQYINIGTIYYAMNNLSDALKYFSISLKKAKERSDENQIIYADIFLGRIYFLRKDNKRAMEYFSEFLNLAKNNYGPYSYRIADGYFGIAGIFLDEGNFTKALQYQFTALNTFENNLVIKARGYIGIGKIYSRQAASLTAIQANKKYLLATKYLTMSLKFIKVLTKIYDRELLLDAYLSLARSYTGLMDYKNALHYTLVYSQMKDSLANIISISKVAEQSMKYEEEKTAVGEKVNQEKLKADQQRKYTLMLAGMGCLLFSSIFIAAFIHQRTLKKRAVEKSEAIHKMAELEMQSLRTQLNPHFIFNSLNSIQELILLGENEKSQSYLSRFSKLLRMLLENAEKPFIPLQKEIDFLRLYLSLESLRVSDLQYSISTDPSLNTEQILIPNMILQPYIENAIWHGLSHKTTDKQLQIRILGVNGMVTYEIEDNGVGRKKAAELKSLFRQNHQSKGMELLSKRFKLLNEEYSAEINTTITDVLKNDEVAGTLVRVQTPVMSSMQL